MFPRIPAILTALILIAACNTPEKVETPAAGEPMLNLLLPSFYETLKKKPTSIYGVWRVKGTFMYSNVLNIKKDGTFSYYEGTCLGDTYSVGNWRGLGYSFALNSFAPSDTPIRWSGQKELTYYSFNNENAVFTAILCIYIVENVVPV